MRRLLVPILVLLLVTLIPVPHAGATAIWCKSDPVVRLNGTVVDITIGIPLEYIALVDGPVRYEIRTPRSTTRQLLVSGPGFNGYGEEVFFTDGDGVVVNNQIPTRILVTVPIDESRLAPGEVVPTELTVVPAKGLPVVVQGTSDLTDVKLTVLGS